MLSSLARKQVKDVWASLQLSAGQGMGKRFRIAKAQLMDYVASRLNPAWLTVFNIQEGRCWMSWVKFDEDEDL